MWFLSALAMTSLTFYLNFPSVHIISIFFLFLKTSTFWFLHIICENYKIQQSFRCVMQLSIGMIHINRVRWEKGWQVDESCGHCHWSAAVCGTVNFLSVNYKTSLFVCVLLFTKMMYILKITCLPLITSKIFILL